MENRIAESRIGRLDLHAAAEPDAIDAVRRLAPPFARRVLTRLDELLEERAPGRCIFIRRLETKWRLLADRLDDPGELEVVAAALADGVENELATASPRDGNIVAFPDEVEYRVDYLAAAAANRAGAWFYEPLTAEGNPPGALLSKAAIGLLEEVLVRLAERGALASVLVALPSDGLDALSRAIGASTLRPSLATEGDAPDEEAVDAIRAMPAGAPIAARRILCLVEARRGHAPHASDSQVRQFAERLLGFSARQQREEATAAPLDSSRDGERRSDEVHHARHDIGTADTSPTDLPVVDTRFGGLFYLLATALELSVGEIIWQACLPEDVFFAHVATAILGPQATGDSAPRLFGGASPDIALPPLDEERLEELAIDTLRGVVEALPRRALATWPKIECVVADSGVGRLLVATPAKTLFPLFAWPAPSGAAIAAGLQRFLSVWPAGAPAPTAHPALAEADRTGRVRADFGAPLARPLLIAAEEDSSRTAAVMQTAGSLVSLFAARCDALDPESAAALVARYFSTPARIMRMGNEQIVRMPPERIDLAVRRAGLDRDPGWVPWLRAYVRIEYDDVPEPDGA